jgi:DNA mismatch endonuclease (patch repair protein)
VPFSTGFVRSLAMEKLTKEQRSANMRAVKSRDTGPEKIVRSLVHRMGYRFRLSRNGLPGKPDLVFPGRRAAIFVHGCFWHSHSCKRGSLKPKTNADFWAVKLARNAARDEEQIVRLKEQGWRSLVVWECAVKDERRLAARLRRFLESRTGS